MSDAKADPVSHHPDRKVVIDVGSGEDPDDRATHTADIRGVADEQFDATSDRWAFPDNHADGIILNHVVEHWTKEQTAHAFREAGRVLGPGGWLELTVPLGANFRTDGDHEPPVWTWERPEMWSRDHRRGWDPDVPFTLLDRTVRLWTVHPFGFLTPAARAVQRSLGDGLWTTEVANAPLMSGELTARYEVVT